ncbi:MAG: dephospho-CoA kinase [Clostridiales bacterium]|nr:dephospho-CoA kinase [Clostridiales bacterium]
MKPNRKIIGLTGNIASGKSTVSKYLIENGYEVIDADLVAREVVEVDSKGLILIVENFGKEILNEDGSLDRKKLGSIVFSDKNKLSELNNLLHPLIRNEILNRIKNSTEQIVFVDAALLYETNLDKIVDEVWCVALDDDIQLDRLMKRDNIDKLDALNRIDSQESNESKIEKADIIIMNNFETEDLYNRVDEILNVMGLDKPKS